jgi:hypothetical protein
MNRRELIGIGLLATSGSLLGRAAEASASSGAPGIFNPRSFGATGDGKTLDTEAINRAIQACHDAGGGVVYLSPGAYHSGTVILRSNVTLYLEAGATLLGSKNISDYKPQAGPRLLGDANQKHLVFARDAQNVAVAGPGRIDGQGPAFWAPSGRVVPPAADSWRDVATYDWKPLDRASPLIEFYRCKNLRIEDVRIENASGWTLRPIECDNVFIRGITIKNPVIGPNTDGIDPTGCRNVFISDSLIDTGDDCICLKSENPYGGEVQISKNITITNCVLSCCCNGLKFGTATRGAFENVTFSNSVIYNEAVDYRARVISGIALEMVDGGSLEGVVISNIRMQRVRTPIFIRRGNRRSRPDGTPGTLRGVRIENIHASESILSSSVTGIPGFVVEDVTLNGIRIDSEEGGAADWTNRPVPEQEKAYPEARMFGRLPAYGLYCRHVKGLRLRDLEFQAVEAEARPAVVCDDVSDLEIAGLRSASVSSGQPVVKLAQVQGAWLRGCQAPAGTKTFLQVQGDKTARVALTHSNLSGAGQSVEQGPDVPKDAVTIASNV